jgi:hypothetical protein
MSRFFNGPSVADSITFSVGNSPPDEGPITIAVLAHPSTATFTAWSVQGRNGTSGVWSILVDSGKLFCEGDFGTGGPSHGTGWCWYVLTKAAGSVIPRWHMHDLTAATAWVHQNDTANVGDGSGPITNIMVGSTGSAAQTWRGRIAIVAAWASELSDLQVEAACTLVAADTKAALPNWMVRLNQASTATSVLDDTGGGGDQSALSGTAVDGDDPPGYNYSIVTTTPFTKDLTESYRVLNAVTKDIVERYRVLNAFSKDAAESYRVFGGFSKDTVEAYRVLNALSVDITDRYRVLNAWTKNRPDSYVILAAMAINLVERYRVFAGFGKNQIERYTVGEPPVSVQTVNTIAYLDPITVIAYLRPVAVTAYPDEVVP